MLYHVQTNEIHVDVISNRASFPYNTKQKVNTCFSSKRESYVFPIQYMYFLENGLFSREGLQVHNQTSNKDYKTKTVVIKIMQIYSQIALQYINYIQNAQTSSAWVI